MKSAKVVSLAALVIVAFAARSTWASADHEEDQEYDCYCRWFCGAYRRRLKGGEEKRRRLDGCCTETESGCGWFGLQPCIRLYHTYD